MTRPTAREFAARCWELRPTSAGVLVMTLCAAMCNALFGWHALVCALAVMALATALCAVIAALELSNEAAVPVAAAEPKEEGDGAEVDES